VLQRSHTPCGRCARCRGHSEVQEARERVGEQGDRVRSLLSWAIQSRSENGYADGYAERIRAAYAEPERAQE
jgi:hypothetical protein